MFWSLLQAILALPVMVALVFPGFILMATAQSGPHWELAGPASGWFWLALALLAAGLTLAVLTVSLFLKVGEGTPAPWDPPKRLVVRGVYRHLRNPMISGVIAILFGEAALFQSPGLLIWAGLFALANALYIPLSEERGLEARFGDDYLAYKAAVPRWVPRLTAWRGLDGGDRPEA